MLEPVPLQGHTSIEGQVRRRKEGRKGGREGGEVEIGSFLHFPQHALTLSAITHI